MTYVFHDTGAQALWTGIERIDCAACAADQADALRSGDQPMILNSIKTRVAVGLALLTVGLTGAFAVKNGLAEIQRLTPAPEMDAAAVAVSQPAAPAQLAAPENATAALEPDPFAQDPQVPRAEITTVEAERILPIPETEEFHSQIFRGSVREDVRLPANESAAPNARDPE